MTYTPFAYAESLHIGTVDFISPNEVKVLLDIEAPNAVALNADDVHPFPRIHGYVLIPVDEGYLVGQIEWMTIERSAFPKRRGMQDFGLVDLPYPLRKMSLNPLGTLRRQAGPEEGYIFQRGADALPSVGSPVLLPTKTQLHSIIESGEHRRVCVGTSPLASNATVSIDPDRLFGRHLAVLGNTGSGKSCSVAGLIRWSLEAATDKQQNKDAGDPNARFIVLDPNGEYARAFSGNDKNVKSRIFKVITETEKNAEREETALKVPLWFWNSAEWSSFTQASAKTQRPLLRRTLREVKAGRFSKEISEEEQKLALRRYLSSSLIAIQDALRTGVIKTDESKFGYRLKAFLDDLRKKSDEFPDYSLEDICNIMEPTLDSTCHSFEKNGKTIEYYRAFTEEQVTQIIEAFKLSLDKVGGIIYQQGPDEDVPLPFRGVDLADHLEILTEQENVSQFLDFLVSRIRTFLSDPRIKLIIDDDESDMTLEEWLMEYIGSDRDDKKQVVIIDLSLVPAEIVHVITSVTARMIFEALQRYRQLNEQVLPTVLIMEEAHTFIKRYRDDVENYDAASICCQVFERIAREGRKFGLGLVLSSQRPSELSPTVLSQCNTFLLHRISNDRDQELVHRLVPDNLRGLLRELPSLPSQHAILLGWASELPVLLKINKLPKSQQPHSDDPDFWDVWTGIDKDGNPVNRKVDWKPVADDWQNTTSHSEEKTVDDQAEGPQPQSISQ